MSLEYYSILDQIAKLIGWRTCHECGCYYPPKWNHVHGLDCSMDSELPNMLTDEALESLQAKSF